MLTLAIWCGLAYFIVNLLFRYSLRLRDDTMHIEKSVLLALVGIRYKDSSKIVTTAIVTLELIFTIALDMIRNLLYKILIALSAGAQLLLSSENQGLSQRLGCKGGSLTVSNAYTIRRRKVIFIRHAESVWNQTFNRGLNFSFFPRLLTFIGWEWALWFDPDSVLFDSPLSSHGVSQSFALQQWILTDPPPPDATSSASKVQKSTVEVLRGQTSSVVVVSNLRRAISTAFIAFGERFLKNSEERAVVVSALQEATRNPDGLTLSKARNSPPVSHFEKALTALRLGELYSMQLDCKHHNGNKRLTSKLVDRLSEFARWLFQNGDENETFIVVGHSSWFKNFFATYLPAESLNVNIGRQKLQNCGVVRFDLLKLESEDRRIVEYQIDDSTVSIVYGGLKSQ